MEFFFCEFPTRVKLLDDIPQIFERRIKFDTRQPQFLLLQSASCRNTLITMCQTFFVTTYFTDRLALTKERESHSGCIEF